MDSPGSGPSRGLAPGKAWGMETWLEGPAHLSGSGELGEIHQGRQAVEPAGPRRPQRGGAGGHGEGMGSNCISSSLTCLSQVISLEAKSLPSLSFRLGRKAEGCENKIRGTLIRGVRWRFWFLGSRVVTRRVPATESSW